MATLLLQIGDDLLLQATDRLLIQEAVGGGTAVPVFVHHYNQQVSMSLVLRQSTASQEILLGPFVDSTDGNTAETALTIANTDIKVFKNGGTTLTDKNSGGATHISNGYYYAVLDATDTDTVGNLEINVKVSGALAVKREFTVLPANIYDSLVSGTDLIDVSVTQLLGTAWLTPGTAGTPDVNIKLISGDSTAADNAEAFFDGTGYAGTNNVIPTVTTVTTATNVTTVNGLAANVITAAAIADGAIDAATFAADVDAEILSYIVDDATRIDASSLNTASATTTPAISTELAKVPKSDSNVTWNATAAAQIQTEATDALNAYDPPTRTELTSDTNSVLARMRWLVLTDSTIGSTGNDTTHVHLPGLTYGNDEINGYLLVLLDVSTGEYHWREITDWVLATELATVSTLPFTPQNATDTYAILASLANASVTGGDATAANQSTIIALLGTPAGASVSADILTIDNLVDDLEGRLTSTRAGYLDNLSAGAVALESTAQSILTDTAEIGTAGAGLTNINLPNQTMDIVGNITGNLSGSVGSVTGNVGGTVATVTNLTNAPTSGDLTATMKASVNTEVLDVLNVDTFAELSAPPAATSSLRDKLTWLFMWARNKATSTSTQRKLYADDGTTVVSTEALSDDATTYTKGEAS